MNPCYKCWTIEGGICLSGEKCIYYNAKNIEAEIRRRDIEKAERLRKQAEKLERKWNDENL
jgi:hypothetical protein